MEENKEKLPLTINPVARPEGHIFRYIALFSSVTETSITANPRSQNKTFLGPRSVAASWRLGISS